MDTNKIASTILDLENVVSSAEELHAITLLQYDSFVEGKCFSNESEFYKTITSIIEREAGEVYGQLQEIFNELYALTHEEEKQNRRCSYGTYALHSQRGCGNPEMQPQQSI